MSTNISEIMYEMEQAGMKHERVAEIVTQLLIAGQRTVYAGNGDQAPSRVVGRERVVKDAASLLTIRASS